MDIRYQILGSSSHVTVLRSQFSDITTPILGDVAPLQKNLKYYNKMGWFHDALNAAGLVAVYRSQFTNL